MASEAMSALTGGTFLVAMALLLGASNFQIGLLVALPTLTNIFQLLAIRLLQKYNNRRAIAVLCNGFARFPLLIIGLLPLLFTTGTSIQVVIFLLFFHYLFGSVAGASWNSWMKDLVPEKKLGSYFSHRTRLTQTLNVFLSLTLALVLDYVKRVNPAMELSTYGYMFIGGGILGLLGTWILSKTPEPVSNLPKENLFRLFKKPLVDKNFRNLLFFNSFWSFALNVATPFFTVYMMKNLDLALSYIICFVIMGQVAGIFSVKIWGKHSDRFSNKTIIKIAAPMYILCILAWPFASMPSSFLMIILIVAVINIMSGVATSGINLALNNIGIKLAPKNEAIVYLSAKNMLVAFVSALGPLLGGLLADFFANRSFVWNVQWHGPNGSSALHLLELHNIGFLFVIAGILATIALRTLRFVKEEGEVSKDLAIAEMKVGFKTSFKDSMKREAILSFLYYSPVQYQRTFHRKLKNRIEHRVVTMRKWRHALGARNTA
jgi:MFS family permease